MPSHLFYFSFICCQGKAFAQKVHLCLDYVIRTNTRTQSAQVHARSHTGATSASHVAARQAYTCRRICDCNQINWFVSPWKRRMSDAGRKKRPLVASSWRPLTLTRGRGAGAGVGGVTARLPTSASLLWLTCLRNYCGLILLDRGGISICCSGKVGLLRAAVKFNGGT